MEAPQGFGLFSCLRCTMYSGFSRTLDVDLPREKTSRDKWNLHRSKGIPMSDAHGLTLHITYTRQQITTEGKEK